MSQRQLPLLATRLALAWLVVVCLLLAHNAYLWLGQRITPDTDILALLPVAQRDPVLQQSFNQMVEVGQQRVMVLVGAPDWAAAKRAATAYRAVLARQPGLLQEIGPDAASQQDVIAQFQPHRLILLGAAQEAQLATAAPQFWLESALRTLYSPFGGPRLGAWKDDPFGLFAGWMQERAQETPVRPRDGQLFVASAEKQYVLLPLTLKLPAFSISAQQLIIPLLTEAKAAALGAVPQGQVITAGVILHAAAAGQQASREMSTIGLCSVLGIILLMWFTFHSLKPIALVLLSIGVGSLGALSVCTLLFERVHLMTLVFGASLIGVAQDYGLHFLCKRMGADAKQDSWTLLKHLAPGLFLTLITTVIGYMGLALTPFPGLRQMALFSACGLVFAWLTVVFWFPLLVAGGTLKSGALVRYNGAALRHWPLLRANRATLCGILLFLLAAAWGIARLGVNDDIRLLQNPPGALVDDQLKLSTLLDAPSAVQYFLVRGASAEIVLQREEALKQRLDRLITQRHLTGYQALSNWVPSAQRQTARRALLEEKLLGQTGPLQQLAAQIGQDAAWLATTRADLLAAGQPLALEPFLHSPTSLPWRHLWLTQMNGETASIVALRGLRHTALAPVQQAGAGLEGVQWVDKVDEISSVLGHYRQTMGQVVLAAYLLVFALMFPRYRGDTWRVLAPTAAASLATLALLGLFGQHLQLFHVLALMLLLGVGVDYGIFIQERPHQRDPTSWLTVGLSASSTILSLGLLGLSNTPALQAFGLTMLIGTTLVWLIVPVFGKESAYDANTSTGTGANSGASAAQHD